MSVVVGGGGGGAERIITACQMSDQDFLLSNILASEGQG